jgi:hypothetical protein
MGFNATKCGELTTPPHIHFDDLTGYNNTLVRLNQV